MSAVPPSQPERVTAWDIDLTHAAGHREACLSLLSDGERERADRFVRDEDRQRFIASHAALRLILGRHLDTDPRVLAFRAAASGKPFLAGALVGACRFNLSHSGDRALVGLSSSAEIGVDVEEVRAMPDLLRIARAHFAASEIAALEALDPSDLTQGFFACWTRKEAVVKATGHGLSLPLDGFAVSVSPAEAMLLTMPGGTESWSLYAPPAAPGYAAAIAVMAGHAHCRLHWLALPPEWPTLIAPPSQQGR